MLPGQTPELIARPDQATRLYQEKSYAQAADLWQGMLDEEKPAADSPRGRELTYRIADARWRALAAGETRDRTAFTAPLNALRGLVNLPPSAPRGQPIPVVSEETWRSGDIWRARAAASLAAAAFERGRNGEQLFQRTDSRGFGDGEYWWAARVALTWWSAQPDSPTARAGFLETFRLLPWEYAGDGGIYAPGDWVSSAAETVLRIAATPADKALAALVLTHTASYGGGPYADVLQNARRTRDAYELAISEGRESGLLDDALMAYADWLASQGACRELGPGQFSGRLQPIADYVAAAVVYQRLLNEFPPGTSKHAGDAGRRLEEILKPSLDLQSPYIYQPGGPVTLNFQSRNVDKVEVTIYQVDLLRALQNAPQGKAVENFRGVRDLVPGEARGAVVATKTVQFKDSARHDYGQGAAIFDGLPGGVYWVEAQAGELTSGQYLRVSDLAISVPNSRSTLLSFVTDAITGAPIADAKVTMIQWTVVWNHEAVASMQRRDGVTDGQGIASMEPATPTKEQHTSVRIFIAQAGNRLMFFEGQYPPDYGQGSPQSRTYIYTDRPAYRPGETVYFKIIHRREGNEGYINEPTPLKLILNTPRGEKALEKTVTTDAYGAISDQYVIPADAALGSYQLSILTVENQYLNSVALFQLEEYKLPEYRVELKTPEKDGKPATFRIGDQVKAEVVASYYSGGPVPNATVDYEIILSPFSEPNPWPEPYPWLYTNLLSTAPWIRRYQNPGYYRQDSRSATRTGQLKTDAQGHATLEFRAAQSGITGPCQYNISVHVTDASRRRIDAMGSVKVTTSSFQINLRPEARLYATGDAVKIQARALDANGNPVAFAGTAIVSRDRWIRKYRKSKATGQEQIIFAGIDSTEVERRPVTSDADGQLRFEFTPKEDGAYRVAITTPEVPAIAPAQPAVYAIGGVMPPERVTGETSVLVASEKTKSLAIRAGQLQIIPDKVTYHAGEKARLMILGPDAGGYLLLTTYGRDLLSHQVVHLEGQAKLVEISITTGGEPNAFIQGLMIRNGQTLTAMEEIVVVPDEQFLNVSITPDASEVRPGAKSQLRVKVTDHDGKPLRTQLSLSVADSALDYLHPDLTEDIRKFFYGAKRLSFNPTETSIGNAYILAPANAKSDDEEIIREGFAENEQLPPAAWDHRRGGAAGTYGGIDDYNDGSGLADPGNRAIMPEQSISSAGVTTLNRQVFATVNSKLDAAGPMPPAAVSADSLASLPVPSPDFNRITVRSDFRASAFWQPALLTNEAGEAAVEVTYPDSLTEWKATARALTETTQVGQGEAKVLGKLPLMVRLQSPRFLVEGDRVTLSAVLNNEGVAPLPIATKLEASHLSLVQAPEPSTVTVAPHGQARIDAIYDVKVESGETEIRVAATSGPDSDAMKKTIPILEHGLEKFVARSEVLTLNDSTEAKPAKLAMKLTLPEAYRAGSVKLRLSLTPSLASTCLDALPYLAQYPYGCVEQTLSRFVPAAITAQALNELKLDPAAVQARIFGGIDPAQAAATHSKPKGDLTKLDGMLAAGVARLTDFRHDDGGWGWWKNDQSNDYMTAYVVQGLALAQRAGVKGIPPQLAPGGAAYLGKKLVLYKDDPDMAAWMLYAVALGQPAAFDSFATACAENAWMKRDGLSPFGRSLLALAFHEHRQDVPDYEERAHVLIRNLENGVVETAAESSLIGAAGSSTMPVTAHWGSLGIYRHWYDGGVEATAMALRAMLAIDPQNKRVDQAARWLINNRRGSQWTNTRDTAIVVMSLVEYMRQTQEAAAEMKLTVNANGERMNALAFGTGAENDLGTLGTVALEIPEKMLRAGENTVEISASGRGRLYASAYLEYYTKENPILASGNEIYVQRQYERETQVTTVGQGVSTVQTPLHEGDELKSGDLISVRLRIEAKNDYEYLLLEDSRAAGCEVTAVTSGEYLSAHSKQADGAYEGAVTLVYPEWRDRWAAFFFTRLTQGTHELRYQLRAETPGRFSALPSRIHAMYVPEIRANGDETHVVITESKKITP